MNKNQSLCEIEGRDILEDSETSPLIRKVDELWSTPLYLYTNSDLRLMIGQELGLDHLLPIALEILTDNPFIRSDLYYGDLLAFVMSVSPDYWHSNPSIYWKFAELIAGIPEILKNISAKISTFELLENELTDKTVIQKQNMKEINS